MYRYYFIVILTASLVLGDIDKISSQDIYFNKRESFISFKQKNHCNSLLATDSGYIVTGVSLGAFYGYDRINIAYFDKEGNRIKNRSYFGNTGYIYNLGNSGCIIETDTNNLLICGFRKDTIANTGDVGLLIKLDKSFDTIWSKIFSDTATNPYNHYYFYQVKETSDSNFILVGIKKPHGKNTNILLLKTDPNGNLLWERTYGQGGYIYEHGYSVIETIDKGYLLGCIRYDYRFPESPDPIVIKIDSAMQFQWEKNLGGPYRDGKALVTKSPDNHYIIGTDIADSMLTPYVSYSRININKMDTAGNIIWNKRYGPSAIDNRLSSLYCYENGTIVVSGSLYKLGLYKYGWLLKVDCNGDSLWMRYYDFLQANSSQNIIYDFKKDYYNGYIACGDLLPFPPDTGNRDIWLLKVDSIGCDTPGCDTTVFIRNLLLKENNPCVIYPNPVTNLSHVELNIPGHYDGYLYIYNIYGRLIRQIPIHSDDLIVINRKNLSREIYAYKIILSNKKYFSGKFVVM